MLTSTPSICDEVCAREVTVPTLLQWGREDRWLPSAFGREIEEMLSESWFVEYDSVGHVPMEETPHETAADARRFLETLD